MKLIVAGATGYVGSEVIRQSLRMPQVTSIIALARKPIKLEEGVDASKLKSVIVKDYGEYPEDVRKEFTDADACIWTVAVTPSKSKTMDFDEVKRVCSDCALAGLGAMYESGPKKPFRFLYMSGVAAERDPNKTPRFMPEYSLMRGDAENRVLAFAEQHKGEVEACAAKPGLILDGGILKSAFATVMKFAISLPNISTKMISVAMLNQVINGFEKEPLMNDDMVQIGERVQRENESRDSAGN